MFIEPRHDRELKFEVSAWGNVPSAATRAQELAQVNGAFVRWAEEVVPSFSAALVSSLEERSVAVERKPQADSTNLLPDRPPFVRSFLGAGFVYKTYTSSTFAPFVHVVLELVDKGRPVYHKLYVASNRPFNPFMDSLPADTPFLAPDLDSLRADPSQALDAFRVLAAQLGKKFASELLA